MSLKVQEIEEGVELSPFDDLWFAREYEKAYIPLDKPLPPPETLISIGEHQYKGNYYPTTVMTAGSFSVIAAPRKAKKHSLKRNYAPPTSAEMQPIASHYYVPTARVMSMY